ncbi:MAG: hypothetical protein WA624_16585 [Methylocella sp.]
MMNQFRYIVYTAREPSFLISGTWPNDCSLLFDSNVLSYTSIVTFASSTCTGIKHVLHINELDTDKYYLKEPIEVTITNRGDQILAEFVEAEISVSEDTASEALSWLKGRIVGSYVRFKNQLDKLGPVPVRQLKVLERYIGEEQQPS